MVRGAKRGENRFGDHQAKKVDLRLTLIRRVIENIRHRRITFPNKWQLSQFVCDEVNNILKKEYPEIYSRPRGKLTVPTISTKNQRYSRELDRLLSEQESENNYSEKVSRIFELELELDELKDENQRLNKYISSISQKDKNNKGIELLEGTDDRDDDMVKVDACHKIIMALLEASDETLIINDDQIEDSSRIADKVVVCKTLLKQSGLLESYLFKGWESE
ncbi:hypothetical protein [Idiomarina sp.]|uniref:hypothetical protein n=1 Tax=Idiomarina sp. TaxID=1874361 RepID=UPI003519A5F4